MGDVIVLQASLDPTAVERALEQIEKRVDQMVSHSDKRVKTMGTNMDSVLKSLRSELRQMESQELIDPKEIKRFKNLKVEILRTAEALEELIANERIEFQIDLETGGKVDFTDMERRLLRINEDILREKIARMGRNAEPEVRKTGDIIEKELNKALKDSTLSADELLQVMRQLTAQGASVGKNVKDLKKAEFEGQVIGIDEGAFAGGMRKSMQESVDQVVAEDIGKSVERRVDRLMRGTNEKVRTEAAKIKQQLVELFDAPPETEEFERQVNKLLSQTNKLEGIKPTDIIDAEELSDIRQANAQLNILAQTAAESSGSVSAAAAEEIAIQQQRAQAATDNANTQKITGKEAQKIIADSTKKIKDQAKGFREVTESVEELSEEVDTLKPVSDKILDKKAHNQFNALMKETETLMNSQEEDAQDIGKELNKLGKEAKDAFDKGDKELEEFSDEMDKFRGKTKDAGHEFGVAFGPAQAEAENARVSIWKVSRAIDGMGVRSAGNVLRVVDALGGLGPVAVGAAVAIGGIAIAVGKVVQAMAELAKRAAQAFYEFNKAAVESARSVEVVDRQLGGLLNNPALGEGFRNLLLDTSFDVGLNLTNDFARVVVPLARDLEQVEEAAEIAASLAHAFQETDESIANAIKQASGGHFRPLIERFGLTEREVQKIKDYQDTMGELGGVLEGLGEAIEARGLELENFHGTLQFLAGQLGVVREQIQIAFGEPVRDALAQQLDNLFGLVEKNKTKIVDFFEAIGEAVGDVIGKIGELAKGLIGNITDTDIEDFEKEIKNLSDAIILLIENVQDLIGIDEDTNLVIILTDLTEAMTNLTEALQYVIAETDKFLEFWDKLNSIRDFEILGVPIGQVLPGGTFLGEDELENLTAWIELAGKTMQGTTLNAEEMKAALEKVAETAPDDFENLLNKLKGVTDESEALLIIDEALTNQMSKGTDVYKERIDAAYTLGQRIKELEAYESDAAVAQAEIDEELAKFAQENYIEEEKIRTRFARQRNQQEIKRSEQREDLESRHIQRMLQMTDKYNFDREQAILGFDRKETDTYTKYSDKLIDIELKASEKKIDIERKYRDKLKDIRAKFDLDAEEAIRRNDAVALLRIRRRMALELKQAEEQRDRQTRDADDAAQKERDAAEVWRQRAIRDNNLAEQRKLDDLIAADEQRRKELSDQYSWEYNQIDIQHQRAKDRIDQNEKDALEDMIKAQDYKKDELDKKLEEKYGIVQRWLDAENEYYRLKNIELEGYVAQRLQYYTEGTLSRYLTSPSPAVRGATAGGGTRYPSGGHQYLSPYEDPRMYGGGHQYLSPGEDPRMQEQRQQVGEERQQYESGGSGSTIRVRQHGGPITQGNRYRVNERGIEGFLATRAGIIMPHEPFMMSPMNRGGTMNIDNSRNVNADMSLYDPSYVSPIQRAVVRQIITEEYLKWGVIS